MKKYSMGVDIGGTKCVVSLGKPTIPVNIEEDAFILETLSFPTEIEKGPEYIIRIICQKIEDLIQKHSIIPEEVVGIGISCGGPLDHVHGIIFGPPNLFGWDNVPIVEIIKGRFSIDTYLQNDADACALAEWHFGAAKGLNNIVFLTFGTGMGAGLILNGRLYTGANDMAGEIGHVRLERIGPAGFGKLGSFEGFCSGNGITQLAKMKVLEKFQQGIIPSFCTDITMLETLDAKIVGDAANHGDLIAQEIYRDCGEYLGRGLAILVDLLNPDMIVIGSIFSRSKGLLWPKAHEVLEQEALSRALKKCQVVPAKLGDQIGNYAALSVAFSGQK